MPVMSAVAAMLTIVPVLAVAINFDRTLSCECSALKASGALRFITFGVAALIISGLASAIVSVGEVGAVTNFTWLTPALTQLGLYGFFAMVLFGAIYHIAPQLTQTEFPSSCLIKWHFRLATLGIIFFVVPLAAGGIVQGLKLNNTDLP